MDEWDWEGTEVYGLYNASVYSQAFVLARLGLGAPEEAARTGAVLRVVYLPSFDPELCLTLWPADAGEGELHLATLQTNLSLRERYEDTLARGTWLADAPRPIPPRPTYFEERQRLPAARFEALCAKLAPLRDARSEDHLRLALDGMTLWTECLDSRGDLHAFESSFDPRAASSALALELARCAMAELREPESVRVLRPLRRYGVE